MQKILLKIGAFLVGTVILNSAAAHNPGLRAVIGLAALLAALSLAYACGVMYGKASKW